MPAYDLNALREAQVEEIETLQSIFYDSFLPPAAWHGGNVALNGEEVVQRVVRGQQPFRFRVRLVPSSDVDSSHNYVAITACVTLPRTYPSVAPLIELTDPAGLPKKHMNVLKTLLQEKIAAVGGRNEPVLYDVLEALREYLQEHNQAPITMDEQMKRRDAEDKARKQKVEERRRNRLRERRRQEAQKLRSAVQKQLALEPKELSVMAMSPQLMALDGGDAPPAFDLSGSSAPLTNAASLANKPVEKTDEAEHKQPEEWEDYFFDLYGTVQSKQAAEEMQNAHAAHAAHDELLAEAAGGERRSASRYRQDFSEVSLLGAGGFGKVVKARNRLDGLLYAVKKVKLKLRADRRDQSRKTLREVTTIARLQHPHIVRYYQAWLERLSDQDEDDSFGETDSDSDGDFEHSLTQKTGAPLSNNASLVLSRHNSMLALDVSVTAADFDLSESDVGETFFSTTDDELDLGDDDGDTDVSETDTDDDDDEQTSQDAPYGFNSDNASSGGSIPHKNVDTTKTSMLLYIQMELCDKETLRTLIAQTEAYLPPDGTEADMTNKFVAQRWRIARQILEAMAFVHAQGVVHRDLKPENVFIDREGNAKIGDFGLATSLRHSQSPPETQNKNVKIADLGEVTEDLDHSSTSAMAGTVLYMSPSDTEQSDKSDMFALGILLFELFHGAFVTESARVTALQSLRTGDSVRDEDRLAVIRNGGTVAWEIITELCQREGARRPSAQALLDSGRVPVDIERAQLQHCIDMLHNNNQDVDQPVLDALFTRSQPPFVEYTYTASLTSELSPIVSEYQSHVQRQVCDRLVWLLESHGAIEEHVPLLAPVSNVASLGMRTAQLLDRHGVAVRLCDSMTAALCLKRVADRVRCVDESDEKNDWRVLRRFSLADVYESATFARAHPVPNRRCGFQLYFDRRGLSDFAQSEIVFEAETALLLHRVALAFHCTAPAGKRSSTSILIGHTDIVDAVLRAALAMSGSKSDDDTCDESQLLALKEWLALVHGDRSNRSKKRNKKHRHASIQTVLTRDSWSQCPSFLSPAAMRFLRQFAPSMATNEQLITLLESQTDLPKVALAGRHLRKLLACLVHFGVPVHTSQVVQVHPLLCVTEQPQQRAASGSVTMQLVHVSSIPLPSTVKPTESGKSRLKNRHVVGVAGRFDSLLRTARQDEEEWGGVGLWLDVERLSYLCLAHSFALCLQEQADEWPSLCDVKRRIATPLPPVVERLSKHVGGVLLHAAKSQFLLGRSAVAASLWKHGIAARLHGADTPLQQEELWRTCRRQGVRWLVLCRRQSFRDDGLVRVQRVPSLCQHDPPEDVSIKQLPQWLLSQAALDSDSVCDESGVPYLRQELSTGTDAMTTGAAVGSSDAHAMDDATDSGAAAATGGVTGVGAHANSVATGTSSHSVHVPLLVHHIRSGQQRRFHAREKLLRRAQTTLSALVNDASSDRVRACCIDLSLRVVRPFNTALLQSIKSAHSSTHGSRDRDEELLRHVGSGKQRTLLLELADYVRQQDHSDDAVDTVLVYCTEDGGVDLLMLN